MPTILTTEQIVAYREAAKAANHYSLKAIYVRTQDLLDLLDEVEASRLTLEMIEKIGCSTKHTNPITDIIREIQKSKL